MNDATNNGQVAKVDWLVPVWTGGKKMGRWEYQVAYEATAEEAQAEVKRRGWKEVGVAVRDR